MRAAGQALLDRHANLRVAFRRTPGRRCDGLPGTSPALAAEPTCGLPPGDAKRSGRSWPGPGRAFDPAVPPLLRMTLIVTGPDRAELVLAPTTCCWTAGRCRCSCGTCSSCTRRAATRRRCRRVAAVPGVPGLAGPRTATRRRRLAAGSPGENRPCWPRRDRPDAGRAGPVERAVAGLSGRPRARPRARHGVTAQHPGAGALGIAARPARPAGATWCSAPPSPGRPPRAARRRVDDRAVHQHRAGPGHPAARRNLAELLRRLQDGRRAVGTPALGLADIQRPAGHGELFDTVTVFESYPVDDAAWRGRHRRPVTRSPA